MWLSVGEIRQKFNIQSNAYASQIESAIGTAGRKISTWLSPGTYLEAIADTAPTDPADLIRYETVIDAHAFLTMYFLVVSAGSKLSGDGFIKQAQDSASVEGSRTITNQYLTPAEMAANKNDYLSAAKELIEPYKIVETAPEDPFQNFSMVLNKKVGW